MAEDKKADPKKNLEGLGELELYDRALNLLTIRDHSIYELRTKLLQKGADPELIPALLAKLVDLNFLNDERYAERVFTYWLHKGAYGKKHLEAELYKRGLPKDILRSTLELLTEELETERAELAVEQFVSKSRRKIAQAKEPLAKKKLSEQGMRYLVARGFSSHYFYILSQKLHFYQDID